MLLTVIIFRKLFNRTKINRQPKSTQKPLKRKESREKNIEKYRNQSGLWTD